MREQFLCQEVPPPPPNVDTNLPPFDESKPLNNRQRMSAHATSPVCAGCHNLMDPIGFGLEKYDAIGGRREKQKLLFFPAGHGVAAAGPHPRKYCWMSIPAPEWPVSPIRISPALVNWANCWPVPPSARSDRKQVFR